MNKIKIIFEYLLSFIFSITLTILVILAVYKYTIGDKEYLYQVVKDNNYYEKIYDEIYNEMESSLLSSGFTNEIIENIYTKEEVINDINFFIENLYSGNKTTLDKTNIKNIILKRANEYLVSNNFEIINQKDLNLFINDLVNIYVDEICLYGFIDNYTGQFYKINVLLNKVIVIMAILNVILLLIMIVGKNKFIPSSLIASGFIILFIELFIFEKIDIESILIITENFSFLIQDILFNLKKIFHISGILFIFIGIIFSFLKSVNQKRKKQFEY